MGSAANGHGTADPFDEVATHQGATSAAEGEPLQNDRSRVAIDFHQGEVGAEEAGGRRSELRCHLSDNSERRGDH